MSKFFNASKQTGLEYTFHKPTWQRKGQVTEVARKKPRGTSRQRVEEHLVSLVTPTSFEAGQYRALSFLLEQKQKTDGLKVIAVSSPTAGDGKTTTSINLAGAMALSHKARVLLVDADLRRPAVASQLGMSDDEVPGFADAIMKPEFALKDVVREFPRFHKVIAVSSPTAGDGKTTTSINPAEAMALSHEARVLLVDADLRRPAVASQLGMSDDEGAGFENAIMKPEFALKDVVREYPRVHLAVLPAGRCPLLPDEVFKSARVGELLEEARTRYDYIVLDTPPLVLAPDCRMIAKWVDGFLMVVAAHKTPQKLVEEALNIMDPANLIGLVFNYDDHLLSHYYGYYGQQQERQELR